MSEIRHRVTIVHRHELFASALEQVLTIHGSRCRRVVTVGMTTQGVLRDVGLTRPDVVLVGMDLGSADGICVATGLCRSGPRVIALIESDRPLNRGEAFAAGAQTVLAMTSPLSGLIAQVLRATEDPAATDPDARAVLIREYRTSLGDNQALVAMLSRQEKDLLAHLMAGRCVRDIASRRVVSEATVRTQSKSVLGKLGVGSQLAAVALARRAGHSPSSLYAVRSVGR